LLRKASKRSEEIPSGFPRYGSGLHTSSTALRDCPRTWVSRKRETCVKPRAVGHNIKMTEKTSNILYYGGLILLAIGAFGLTFAAFFAIIGLPIFIVGLILILTSLKKSWKQRLIPIGLFIIGIVAFWPIWRAVNSVGPEIFLIPENYRGRVNIVYKKECGIKLEKSDEGLVYNIPNEGILRSEERRVGKECR